MIVHLITDRRRLSGPRSSLEHQRRCLREQVRFAVDAGIDAVQLRERDLDARDLYTLAVELVALVTGSRTRLIINDRLDVALAAGAHGVHLRGDSMAPALVRRMVPHGFLVGRSVHAVSEAASVGQAVDYIIAGTVWSTSSKPTGHALLGIDGLREVIAASPAPVLAIGGVTLARVPDLVHAAAQGFAAIGLFVAAPADADYEGWCGAMALRDVARQVAHAAGSGRSAT